jgi:hypothetical protein
LQGCVDEHSVVQVLLVVSHASPEGQSLATPQPQVPPLPEAMQEPPAPLSAHEVHIPPELPHRAWAVPALHDVPSQQPPLQGCFDEQLVVQTPVARSQASPRGQAAEELHPASSVASPPAPSAPESGRVFSSAASGLRWRESDRKVSRGASRPESGNTVTSELPSLPRAPSVPE